MWEIPYKLIEYFKPFSPISQKMNLHKQGRKIQKTTVHLLSSKVIFVPIHPVPQVLRFLKCSNFYCARCTVGETWASCNRGSFNKGYYSADKEAKLISCCVNKCLVASLSLSSGSYSCCLLLFVAWQPKSLGSKIQGVTENMCTARFEWLPRSNYRFSCPVLKLLQWKGFNLKLETLLE